MRWSATMDEALQALAANPECHGDEMLVALAKLHKVLADIYQVSWPLNDFENAPNTPPILFVKSLNSQLDGIKRSISPQLSDNSM
jgi:hypothetical protein